MNSNSNGVSTNGRDGHGSEGRPWYVQMVTWIFPKTDDTSDGKDREAFVNETVHALFEPIRTPETEKAHDADVDKKPDPLSDTAIRAIYDAILQRGIWFWERGIQDGDKSQVRQDMTSFAGHTADNIQKKATVELSGKRNGLQKSKHDQKAKIDSAQDAYDRTETIWKQVANHRKSNKRYYSRGLGCLYFSIALLLVVADIPLAIEVAEQGFGIPGALDPSNDISNLFTNRFFNVIATNWQPVALSVGIALSAFYVKVFYDEFVGWPLHRKAQRRMDYETGDEYGFTEKHLKMIDGDARFRRYFKILLFMYTVVTLLLIGWLRAETEVAGDDSWTLFILYPLLTLLLPLIGGVFASIGLSCFQNHSLWTSACREKKEAADALRREQEVHSDLVRRRDSCDVALEYFNAREFRNQISGTFAYLYNHGYNRGFVELSPASPTDIDHARAVRRKLTKFRLSQSSSDDAFSA